MCIDTFRSTRENILFIYVRVLYTKYCIYRYERIYGTRGIRVGLGMRNFKGVNCHEQFVYIDIIQAFRDAFFCILDYNK